MTAPLTEAEIREALARAERATLDWLPGYEIARDGSVLSVASNWRGYGPRKLAANLDDNGYLRVRVVEPSGRRRRVGVHRLVCEGFHGCRPSPYHEVRHLNGVRSDNRADNLAWGTRADNAADRDVHGTTARGERNGAARLSTEKVEFIRCAVTAGRTQRDIARQLGVCQSTVGAVARGVYWRTA